MDAELSLCPDPSCLLLLNAQGLVPGAQYTMFSAQCSALIAQCPVLRGVAEARLPIHQRLGELQRERANRLTAAAAAVEAGQAELTFRPAAMTSTSRRLAAGAEAERAASGGVLRGRTRTGRARDSESVGEKCLCIVL